MILKRWRKSTEPNTGEPMLKPFEDLIEEAPVIALLLDRDQRVLAANQAARRFFDIDPAALPRSLVEISLEGSLVSVLRAGVAESEAQLVHRRRIVASKLVPGPRPGETLMFLTDVTDLRRLERVRQEFVANLVHELKTPITSLRLTAESLEHDLSPHDHTRFVRRTIAEADLLSRIIDNLRQLAELDLGAPALHVSTFELRELLVELSPRVGSSHEVNLDVPDGIVLETDRTKLAQALGNLLDNAARFSPPGSRVDVSAAVVDGALRISVRDRGPGISPEHWGRVFERFYKVDRSRTREAGGFGLGLAIAKHLVQSIGGRIWTEAAEDGGQMFAIELPEATLTPA